MSRFSRRHFLTLTGATLTSIAGCSELTENNSQNNLGDDDETPTASPTPTPEPPELQIAPEELSITWTPEIAEKEKIPEEHLIKAELEENDFNPEDIQLILEPPPGTDTREDEDDRETLDFENTELTLQPYQFFDGEQHAYLTYQVENGETRRTPPETLNINIPDAYRLDIRKPGPQPLPEKPSINNWTTPYGYDTHIFNREKFEEKRIDWMQENSYQDFLDDPQSYDLPPNWSDNTIETQEEFEDHLETALAAVQEKNEEYHQQNNSDGLSGSASTIANTASLHFRNKKEGELFGAGVHTNGHGLNVFYHDKWGWYVAETTMPSVGKPDSHGWQTLENYFIPWSDYAADVENEHNPDYQGKKKIATRGLTRLVTSNAQYKTGPANLFINDDWLEAAYQHIRNGGDIEPIIQPLKHAIDKQIQESKNQKLGELQDSVYAGIYGTGLEDTRIAYGENLEQLYDQVMHQQQSLTVTDIETALQKAA